MNSTLNPVGFLPIPSTAVSRSRPHIGISTPLSWILENQDQMKQDLWNALQEARNDNWDDEGAKAVSYETYQIASRFVESLPPVILRSYIMAIPNGKIGFEWRAKDTSIALLTIGWDGKIIYTSNIKGEKKRSLTQFFNGNAIQDLEEQLLRHFKS
jgi:hypothetical protein